MKCGVKVRFNYSNATHINVNGRLHVPMRIRVDYLGYEVKFEFGVTYIHNGKDSVIKEDKYFKQMPPILGKAAYNTEMDYAVIKDYFGEYDGEREIPTYEFDNKDWSYFYKDDQAIDTTFYTILDLNLAIMI